MKTEYAGLDYSGPGSTANRNPDTGIRYGIIPANRVPYIDDILEFHYVARCPGCGDEVDDPDAGKCSCGETWDDCSECYSDEPDEITLDCEGVSGFVDDSGDLWITASTHKVRAQFCSPCAPGACYLLNPCDEGAWAYCLPAEWFDDDEEWSGCPYEPVSCA